MLTPGTLETLRRVRENPDLFRWALLVREGIKVERPKDNEEPKPEWNKRGKLGKEISE
jgi:hypothetical protein